MNSTHTRSCPQVLTNIVTFMRQHKSVRIDSSSSSTGDGDSVQIVTSIFFGRPLSIDCWDPNMNIRYSSVLSREGYEVKGNGEF